MIILVVLGSVCKRPGVSWRRYGCPPPRWNRPYKHLGLGQQRAGYAQTLLCPPETLVPPCSM